jgi:hypothetical protein
MADQTLSRLEVTAFLSRIVEAQCDVESGNWTSCSAKAPQGLQGQLIMKPPVPLPECVDTSANPVWTVFNLTLKNETTPGTPHADTRFDMAMSNLDTYVDCGNFAFRDFFSQCMFRGDQPPHNIDTYFKYDWATTELTIQQKWNCNKNGS